jgi:hypothetical protein
MTRRYFLFAILLYLATAASFTVYAGDLSLNITGAFGPATTLGGVPLGADTPFTFRAVFDPTQELFHTDHVGIFAVTQFAITINGNRTFTGIPNENLNIAISDPHYPPVPAYSAGLVDLTATSFFLDKYSTVTLPFDPHMPTPTTFLNFLDRVPGAFPYIIPLAGGAGELAINDFGNSAPSASLVAVPEPSTQMLVGVLWSTVLLTRRTPSRSPSKTR